MSKIVTFVVCKHDECDKNFLFYAPSFEHLKNGDKVIVDTKYGEQTANVVTACNGFTDSDVEESLRTLCGTGNRELKRVVGKFNFVKFDYTYDDKEGENHE